MKKQKLFTKLLAAALCFNIFTIPAYAAPQTMSDGTVFDAEYYAENNPDVVAVFGNSTKNLYKHYTQYGRNEGRMPTADGVVTESQPVSSAAQKMSDGTLFDPVYYAENNPDVVAVFGKSTKALYRHYVEHGKSEGRKAHAGDKTSSDIIAELREQYPEGTHWDINSAHSVPDVRNPDGTGKKNTGSVTRGSLGWAWFISYTINSFDETNIWKYHYVISTDPNTVKPNDVVWLSDTPEGASNQQVHAVFVLSVNYENRTFTCSEGNYNNTIHWDGTYSFDDIYQVWYTKKDTKGMENVWWVMDGVWY
ncbi:hypothetical protein LJC58_07290 [Lachnospiraceae bacterium OttesenSCG-928-D06]|nr:hypothetical protein [Lachnospiraceae bacterium OttesenSCG-928-D06]